MKRQPTDAPAPSNRSRSACAEHTSRVDGVKAPRDAARGPRVVPEPRLDAEVPRDILWTRLRAVRGDWYRKLVVGVGRELVALQGRAVRF